MTVLGDSYEIFGEDGYDAGELLGDDHGAAVVLGKLAAAPVATSPSGSCKCPKCGAGLELCLSSHGEDASVEVVGWVEVVGGSRVSRVMQAGGSCYVSCPNCGAIFCLAPAPGVARVKEAVGDSAHLYGIDVLGAPTGRKQLSKSGAGRKPLGKPAPAPGAPRGKGVSPKNLRGAFAAAKDAVARAHGAGAHAIESSKIGVKPPLTKVKGWDGFEAEIVGAHLDAAEDEAVASYEIVGSGSARPSAAAVALAKKAAASHARLVEARKLAAGASRKVSKANDSIKKHANIVSAHAGLARVAASKGKSAQDQAVKSASKIADLEARLAKKGTLVSGDEAVGYWDEIIGDKDSDAVRYEKVPDDAVVYPEGKGWDRLSKGSWLYFYGAVDPKGNGGDKGFIWGEDRMGWPASTAIRWIARYGRDGLSGNMNWWDSIQGDDQVYAASMAGVVHAGVQYGEVFGPLIGNPSMPDYAGLHYAVKDNKWFWKAGEAPKWATKELDEAMEFLTKEKDRLEKEAAAAEEAERQKEEAERAAEEARLQAEHDAELAKIAREAELEAKRLEAEDAKNQAELKIQQDKDAAEQGRWEQQAGREEADLERREREQELAERKEAAARGYDSSEPEPEYAEPDNYDNGDGTSAADADPFADGGE